MAVETSPQLFAVMCALYAAGYDVEAGTPSGSLALAQVRGELLRSEGPATQALRAYFREHRAADSAATLSRFVSYALVVGSPPKFDSLMRREDLPPDALLLEGFNEVLAAFYREAKVDQLWQRVQPVYEREVQRLQAPVGQIVFTATGYLREVQRPMRSRIFSVYVEPLVGTKINFRSYGDHYSIVLGPGNELPLDQVQHAYLHFLLDPLAFRYPVPVESRRPLHQFVSRAARIPPEYRDDFGALLTECLVRAVELRLRKLPPDKLAAAIDEAETDGYVLVRSLYKALVDSFDKAEPAMGFFFPDLVQHIDVAAESKRLEKVTFAAALPTPPPSEQPRPSELEIWLRDAERLVVLPDADGAASAFERVLAKYPGQPRALYGLAVARVLQRQVEEAKEILQDLVAGRGLAAPADPLIRAMSHVYLGRIHDLEGNRDLAVSEYRAALAVEGAPEMARRAAQRGMERKPEPARPSRVPEVPRP